MVRYRRPVGDIGCVSTQDLLAVLRCVSDDVGHAQLQLSDGHVVGGCQLLEEVLLLLVRC